VDPEKHCTLADIDFKFQLFYAKPLSLTRRKTNESFQKLSSMHHTH
jgi:hypothetical protein